MANPYTALHAIVSIEDVNRFLTTILSDGTLYSSTYVSSGIYGLIFSIDVDIRVGNPFVTLWINVNQKEIIYSSDNRYVHPEVRGPEVHRFCCKIVIIDTDEEKHSFNNECNKQRDIYASSNGNLNAVCLPLFFYSIVDKTQDSGLLMTFINGLKASLPPGNTMELHSESSCFGISFMPYSANRFVPPAHPTTEMSTRSILQNDAVVKDIAKFFTSVCATGVVDDSCAITLFQISLPIYSCVSIVSLLIRLYLLGYCHGDLHLGNIIVYDWTSGVAINKPTEKIYFFPSFLLIDTGFAFIHGQAIPEMLRGYDDTFNIERQGIPVNEFTYDAFKHIIVAIMKINAPKIGENMMTWKSYHWFSKIFMDNVDLVGGSPALNEDRCKLIYDLFRFFERYRTNFETERLMCLSIKPISDSKPQLLQDIRKENLYISGLVHDYVASIPASSPEAQLRAYNSQGGLRRNYYISNRKQTNRMKKNRKQTKISKKHTTRSMRRRRKSQHRRQQRSRHHSKSKYY